MRRLTLVLVLTMAVSILLCIDVGGHITQDTTWTPENSPYVITSFLYIDAGVTLTIMPGTAIRCTGADKSNINNFMWSGNTQPVAKMIIVHGSINAVGSSENPITFDKYQTEANYRWGGIYMAPNAPVSTFEFCEFRNTFFCDYAPGEWSLAAVVFDNGVINIRNCTFENNRNAIGSGSLQSDVLLYKCKFISINDSYPPPFGLTGFLGIGAASEPVPEVFYLVTVANCFFTGSAVFATFGDYTNSLLLSNVFYDYINRYERSTDTRTEYGSTSSYGNFTYNGSGGWSCYSATISDTVYSRRNILTKPMNANPGNSPLILGSGGFGTNYVSDNYLSGCVQVKTSMSNATTSYIYNNTVENNYSGAVLQFESSNPTHQGGQVRFFNNLVRYNGSSLSRAVFSRNTSPFIYNNAFVNFSTLHTSTGECDEIFMNNIIECTLWSQDGAPKSIIPS